MAETLTELVAKISTDASELKKGLSDAERQTETSSKKMSDSLRKISIAMTASGAAITAALSFMGKAAIDEEIGIKRLGVALKGIGINYDSIKISLEAVIAATEQKTGVSDSEQRDILERLILVTKDYDKALSLLPLTLDLAAAGGIDASTAATSLGNAYEELEGGAEKIGVRIGRTTVYFKDLNEIQQLVGGTAKATVNPFNQLKNAMSNLSEELGANLIPLIKDAVGVIVTISKGIQQWARDNPELARTLTLTTLAIGGVLTIVGGLGLAIPPLITGVRALAVVFGALKLATIEYTVIALAAVVAVYAIINVVRSLKGEAYVGTSIGDTIFGQIKQDLASLTNKIKDFLPAMSEVTDTTEQSIKVTKSLSNAYDPELVKAQEEVIKKTQELQKEQDSLNKKFQDLMFQIYRNEGASYKYGITIDDVYQAMYRLGYTTEAIRKQFELYGNETLYTDILLGNLGLTAEEVAKILGKLKDQTDAATKSQKGLQDQTEKTTKAIVGQHGGILTGAGGVGLPMPAGGLSMTPWGVIVGPGERALGPGGEVFVGAAGGIVTQPTMSLIGEAGPEAVIPLNEMGNMGGVTVNFTQPVFFDREDTMNKFVKMIRDGIQRQDRLRFGGAYNG